MTLMLIFLDESGDTGFKFAVGSSRFFVMVLMIFDSPREAEKVNAAIIALRRELHLRSDYEFRFSTGSSERIKTEFLQTLLPYLFRYRALVVDKQQFWEHYQANAEKQLLEYAVAQLFQPNSGFHNATLFVDRIAGGDFARRFNVAVRQHLKADNARSISKFKHADSRRNNLLQAADMICGAVYRSYAREDDTYRRMIRAKEENVIEWK